MLQAKPREVDLSRTCDATVIGSGADGGKAAHVLTSRGLGAFKTFLVNPPPK